METGRIWERRYLLDKMSLRDLWIAYVRHPAIQTYFVVAAAAIYVSWTTAQSPVPAAAAVALVAIVYPFVWYLLHRFVLHGSWLYRSPITAAVWKRIHFDHHRDPNDLRVLFGALATTLPTVFVVVVPIGWILGGLSGAAAALAAGVLVTCFYEYCHCVQHLRYRPSSRFLRRVKALHLQHHFHDERTNFGITSFLPDRVFGTYRKEARGEARSDTVFNLGYTGETVRRFPWVARLTEDLDEFRAIEDGVGPRRAPSARSGDVEVRTVDGRRDLADFIGVPERLYAEDPNWIAPLKFERAAHFGPRNPYFDHAEVRFFVAYRAGAPVGRVSAQIDRLAQSESRAATGHFGFLEGADRDVLWQMLSAAEDWLRSRDVGRVEGPYSLSINDETGLLIDGQASPPRFLMNYAPPWYGLALEAFGYEKSKDLLAYRLEVGRSMPEPARRLAEQAARSPDVTIRPLDRKRFRRELATIVDIYNDAWSDNWGFVAMTEGEIEYMAASLKPLIRPELVQIAEVDGEAVGMIVALPDLNEALTGLNGRLLPLGWAKLLWRLKVRRPAGARVVLMGVRRAHRGTMLGSALAAAMTARLHEQGSRLGVREVELSWVLEDNGPMHRLIEAVGGTPYKRYRVYTKTLQ